MNVIVLAEPAVEPVTAADAFLHLGLGNPQEDDITQHPFYSMVVRNIATARRQVEQMTRRALVTQTVRLVTNSFQRCCGTVGLELARPPIQSVVAVRYYDDQGELQTVENSPADYSLSADFVPKLLLGSSVVIPCLARRSDAVQVDYVVGYAPAADDSSPPLIDLAGNVPQGLKDAILVGVEILRGAMSPDDRKNLETLQENLVTSYRIALA